MRRFVMFLVLSVALAGALVVAPSQAKPAEAEVKLYTQAVQSALRYMPGYGYVNDISINLACVQQYGAGAFGLYWSLSNPYSWACYRVASWVPYRLTYLGGVDLNRYCQRNHPGTYAYVVEPRLGALGWACVRWA